MFHKPSGIHVWFKASWQQPTCPKIVIFWYVREKGILLTLNPHQLSQNMRIQGRFSVSKTPFSSTIQNMTIFRHFSFSYDTFVWKTLPDIFENTNCIRAVYGQKAPKSRNFKTSHDFTINPPVIKFLCKLRCCVIILLPRKKKS